MNENWVEIVQINRDNEMLEYLKNEFDKNNIKYKIDLEEGWEGNVRIPRYIAKFVVSVPEQFGSEAEKILYQYNEKQATISESTHSIRENWEENEEDTEEESKQIAQRQKRMIIFLTGIVICMVIGTLILAILFS